MVQVTAGTLATELAAEDQAVFGAVVASVPATGATFSGSLEAAGPAGSGDPADDGGNDGGDSVSGGIIAAAVVGGLVVLAGIGAGVWYMSSRSGAGNGEGSVEAAKDVGASKDVAAENSTATTGSKTSSKDAPAAENV